jgi:cell wall-associated NlpC family hydrolase
MSAVAEAALATVGARFRLHGRDVEHGLDCLGVVAVALRGGGYVGPVPSGYALRGGDPDRVAAVLDAALVRCDGMAAGDVLLMATGPGQLHLGVRTGGGFVHAVAGLGRVVERPGADWPLLGAWRLRQGES